MKKMFLGGLAIAVSAMFLACSDDSSSASSSKAIEIKDKTVKGISQKGPFVKGSTVKVYELEEKTFDQTGKSFKGDITSDKGEFSVKSVSLASQYALLEANGYYRNEITGEKSKGTITLNAFTDLSDREKVNVNILTHLEYPRIMKLIESGKTPEEAKEQAESEIFEAFGLEAENNKFEDLSIFNDKALLSISVLLSGNRDAANLTELLSDISEDIAKDGKWDHEKTKKSIANEANELDLKKIRENIENWEISSEVPEFETYVNSFWSTFFDFKECNKKNQGEINSYNISSEKTNYYICDENLWRLATKIEYNTNSFKDAKDGDLKKGTIDEKSIFVFEKDHWREATKMEIKLKKACTNELIGTTEGDYVCRVSGWKTARELNYDLEGVKCVEGKEVKGTNSGLTYVCKNDEFTRVSKFKTWFGTSGENALENEYIDSHWYVTSDGESYVEWPVAVSSSKSNDSLNPVIKECKGLCGKANLKNDEIEFDPYIQITFDLAKKKTDLAEMGGLCIAYTSKFAPSIYLIVDGTDDYPKAKLKKTEEEVNVVNIPWSQFKQDGWGKTISEEDILNSAKKIGIEISAKNDSKGDFSIKAIGPYMGDCDLFDEIE